MDTIETLDAAALAKMIRIDLHFAFRGTKFTVRTSRYAGGSSVHIRWTGGPSQDAVDAALALYCAQGFDGSTDSNTNRGPVRLADGRLVRIYSFVFAQKGDR